MRKRQILIGLFVPQNNRTIGETKITQVGKERAFVHIRYLRPVTAGLGNSGVVDRVRPV